jgi:hypothetical protein
MSLQAGESDAAPHGQTLHNAPATGATPPQSARTSAPHADRSTNNSSRGRMGRSTKGAGGGASAAGAAVVAAAGVLAVPLPPTALTAF